MEYRIKTQQYEGPFNVLLEMIEKQKLDITKFSLAKIADDYLDYVERSDGIDLANLSEFLYVASQLILVKSKALLPFFELDKEEQEEIGDLEERLKAYQKFKRVSESLVLMAGSGQKYLSKSEENFSYSFFSPPTLDKKDLKEIFCSVLDQIPTKEGLAREIVMEVVSLEEKISQLRNSLQDRIKVAFEETIKNSKDKIDIIVTFLAMLEMIKQKMIIVRQDKLFDSILMEKYSQVEYINNGKQ